MAVNVDIKQGITVKEIRDFLCQFSDDVEVAFFLSGGDRTEWVGLYAEDPGEDGYPLYPMVVTAFQQAGR